MAEVVIKSPKPCAEQPISYDMHMIMAVPHYACTRKDGCSLSVTHTMLGTTAAAEHICVTW